MEKNQNLIDNFILSGNDDRLYRQVIQRSTAHIQMLARQDIITQEESRQIINGLEQILKEIEQGEFLFKTPLENIQLKVDARLQELTGSVALKLNIARSRHDQKATDLRLYLRKEIDAIQDDILTLQQSLLSFSNKHVETIMPGFIHLQVAQPTTLAHHLMAYHEMLSRDYRRIVNLRSQINQSPLGAAASASTSLPIDRQWVAEQLGFEGICQNSMDAVSDRDYIIELASTSAMIMMHLSRFSEELILWSSPMFKFIELSDVFCTGSSILPQKNPVIPEIIREKFSQVIAHLNCLITVMKGVPLSYSGNLQDEKTIFDVVDTVRNCLKIMSKLVPEIKVQKETMVQASKSGYSTSKDLADDMFCRGIPILEAHLIVGRLVQICRKSDRNLDQLTLQELQGVDSRIPESTIKILSVEGSVNARKALGGPAFKTVREAIRRGMDKNQSPSLSTMQKDKKEAHIDDSKRYGFQGNNVEIKAKSIKFDKQLRLTEAMADAGPEKLRHEDTYFNSPLGRLKLRVINGENALLIQYARKDQKAPTESQYICSPVPDPETTKLLLARSMGVVAVVRKYRTVYRMENSRIHFDVVGKLGQFIELKVQLKPGEDSISGKRTVQHIMKQLEIDEETLISVSYIDLLTSTSKRFSEE